MADYDVVIAGGGMVGVSLALGLAAALPESQRILLVENFPLPSRDPNFDKAYTPSFDARSTALSYSSYLIYRELGVWPRLQTHACPIDTIHVSEKGSFGSTLMSATDYNWPALGYVVENSWLGNILIQCLHQQSRIEVLSPARVTGAIPDIRGVSLEIEGQDVDPLRTRLLVVADGAESSLRQALGMDVHRREYGQHALIANISHAQPHRGRAFERFTANGPLALLPLQSTQAESRSALVWTLPPQEAEALLQAADDEFLRELQLRFGYRLGRLQRVGERHCYPLALVQAREQVRSGIVVMGNAAHALHPVAGQGFNLALRDVARLCQVLAAEPGPTRLETLQRYQREQAADQERTVGFSDRLPQLFAHSDPALGLLRDIGLSALDLSPALKRQFVRHTAGIASGIFKNAGADKMGEYGRA